MPKIQLRHDTSANFTSVNPVLLVGEFAYETDTKKIKVGDGTTAYTSLEYFGGDTSAIPELQEAVEQLELDYGSLADKVDELETSLENKQDVLTAGDNIFIGYEVVNPNVQPNWGTVQDEWVGTNVSNLFNTITGNNNSVSFKFRKTANFNNINHYITIKSTKGDSLLSIRRGSDDFTLSVSLSSSNWINIPLPSNTATYEFDVLMVDKGTTQDLYVTSGINGKTYTSLNQALVGWNSQPLNLEFKSDNNNLFQVQKSSVKLYNGTQDPKLVISATVEEPELPENVTTQGNTFNGANQLVQLDASGKLPDDIIPLDKLNQSKALETGGVSTDTDVYSDIVNYAHSTFDRSKFQIVGSPVITDDGIASGFSSSNYIVGNHTTVENVTYRFKVYLRSPSPSNALCIFKLNNPNESTNKVLIYQTVSVSGVAITYANNYSTPMDLTLGKTYYFEFKVTTANLTLTAYNEDFSLAGTTSMDITSPIQAYGFNVGVTNGYKVWPYEFDLKSITAESDGVPVFNGNKTGTDTVDEIQIPYVLSKTGSKIVDAAYRDRVQDVYDQYGISQYYTLDEANKNFTLPMGEIYGMIEQKANTTHTHTYSDITSMDSQIAGLAMPSTNYIELTWPESTQNIQGLPNQDGYLYLEKNATAVGQTCIARVLDSSNNFLYRLRFMSKTATDVCTYFIPLPAGCKVSLTYSLEGDTEYMRFFTCKGYGVVQ